jgi:uncharacterized LabA/DUF88 family protein
MVENTQNILNNKEYREDNQFERSQLYKLEKLLKEYNSQRHEGDGS